MEHSSSAHERSAGHSAQLPANVRTLPMTIEEVFALHLEPGSEIHNGQIRITSDSNPPFASGQSKSLRHIA
jgi:hypothetical protein